MSIRILSTPARVVALTLLLPLGAAWAASSKAPAKPAAKAPASKAVYDQNCAVCHGATGKPSMAGVPDFSKKAYLKKTTEPKMIKVITDGAGDKMPAYKKTLTAAQIKSVVAYVKSLGK